MFQIVCFIISVSFGFISSVMVLAYSRGRHGKLALTVTGLSHVPILTRPWKSFLFTYLTLGANGKLALTVTGLSHVPILTRH